MGLSSLVRTSNCISAVSFRIERVDHNLCVIAAVQLRSVLQKLVNTVRVHSSAAFPSSNRFGATMFVGTTVLVLELDTVTPAATDSSESDFRFGGPESTPFKELDY